MQYTEQNHMSKAIINNYLDIRDALFYSHRKELEADVEEVCHGFLLKWNGMMESDVAKRIA